MCVQLWGSVVKKVESRIDDDAFKLSTDVFYMKKLSILITVRWSIDEICRKIGQISQFSVIFRKYPIFLGSFPLFWTLPPFLNTFLRPLGVQKRGTTGVDYKLVTEL